MVTMKKGQITLFIIIGLVLLITATFFIVKSQSTTVSKADLERQETENLPLSTTNFQDYVEGCMQIVTPKAIKSIALKGGFNDWNSPFVYEKIEYNFICFNNPVDGCVNTVRSRTAIEQELEYNISKGLNRCIDISVFEEQGYGITSKATSNPVDAIIGIDDISVVFNYHVELDRKGDTETFTQFTQSFDYPLGVMVDISNLIINHELYEGHFNKDDWMAKHGDVLIKKHRPYPHIMYELVTWNKVKQENFTYRFALQGQDTISNTGFASIVPSGNTGCCKDSQDLCYANSYENECNLYGGTWSNNECLCEGLTVFGDSCDPCEDCGSIPHNSSWCRTQGPAGYGNDYVGARHYKISCIDGNTFVEEARDYREEICANEPVGTVQRAIIRPNRWETCSKTDNKDDCEDQTKHDCQWSEWLDWSKSSPFKSGKCHPQVPPGLKFWHADAISVCNMANNKRTCDGASCPKIFDENMALYCNYMGDCGNSRNIGNVKTDDGFFYVQEYSHGKLRDYIYLDDDAINKVYDLSFGTDYYPPLIRTGKEFNNEHNDIFDLFDYATAYYKEASDWDIPWDLVSCGGFPIVCEMDKYVIDIGLCSLWQPPDSNDCDKCEDTYEICSEYRCKSLGSGCIFETIDGEPLCYEANPNDNSPPQLLFDETKLNAGHFVDDYIYYGFFGKQVQPNMVPFSNLQFGMITDEETVCNINIVPSPSFYIPLDSNLYGVNEYTTDHTIRIPMVPPSDIKDELIESLNLTTILEINDIIADYRNIMLDYASDPEYSEHSSDIMDALDLMDSNYDPSMVSFLTSGLVELDQDTYNLFVYCTDRAGNTNNNPYLVTVTVDQVDTMPPIFVDIIPANNENVNSWGTVNARIFYNEPVECRYSLISEPFEDMAKEFDCYRFSVRNDFSYECNADLSVASGPNRFYYRCRDQPIKYEHYELNLLYAPSTALIEPPGSDDIVIVGNYVNISDNSVLSSATKIGTPSAIDLQMNFNKAKFCAYSLEKDDSFDKMTPIACTDNPNEKYCRGSFSKDVSLITKYHIKCYNTDATIGNIGDERVYLLNVN